VIGTVVPSGTRMQARTPDAGASTKLVALDDSTSTIGSPWATVSPSFFSQQLTRPSCIDMPHLGISTFVAIGTPG